ncbi:MAG: bifunctional 2-polyprenyl-6-hydroxyphenol methylase/3-demethylubiquinol 3-O-methyltransferase UbiG [Pseudomonadota bacterium]
MSRDTTIDQREVEYYSRIADTWWDKAGPFWPLHRLNELRVGYILDNLCQHYDRDSNDPLPLKGLRILDVGCGGGILAESMARLGAEVTGIDVVERNIYIADLHAQSESLPIDYRLCTVAALSEKNLQYDVVLNMEVVEHVADVAAFMGDCCRVTSESGVMFVATINRTLLSWLFAIVGAEYILRWLPRGTHRWSWFRTPAEIEQLLVENGLSISDSTGVSVNPFNRSLALTSVTKVNYMVLAKRL